MSGLRYVYAVCHPYESPLQRQLSGVAGAPPKRLTHHGLVAVVSTVPEHEFTEEALRANLEDLDWLTATARAHQQVIDALPPERLLVFTPKQGWEPLCAFLGVPVPAEPFPRINSRDELSAHSDEQGGLPPDPETGERFARAYIEQLKAKAFRPTA